MGYERPRDCSGEREGETEGHARINQPGGRRRENGRIHRLRDKGRQFDCDGYKDWCRRKGIDPRYAAAESIRASAVIERFFLSLKEEWLRRIPVPLRRDELRRELSCYLWWFEHSRPHQGLEGRTPRGVYDGRPVVEKARWKAKEIPRSELIVRFHEGRRQLPIVEVRRAA